MSDNIGRKEKADASYCAAYYVASVWQKIIMDARGKWLIQQERELWKLGADISGRHAIRPQLTSTSSGFPFLWMVLERGAFWFPRTSRGYEKLWNSISCDKLAYSELANMVMEGESDALTSIVDDVSAIYAHVIAEHSEDIPHFPNKHLGGFFARRWVSEVVNLSDMDVMLDSYFDGVPVEHILA